MRSRNKRWLLFRLTDLCGVFVGILLQSFFTGYTDILYILTGTLIMFFFWYIFALYLPISAMTLLLYHGKEILTLFGRFLIEVGVTTSKQLNLLIKDELAAKNQTNNPIQIGLHLKYTIN